MMQKIVFLLFLSVLSTGCSRPEPNPELKDAIYQDLQSELQLSEKNIAEAEKKLIEAQTEIKKVVPQTGQNKYAEKRLWEAQRVVDRFKQQYKYWIVRKDQRRNYVRQKSLEAFNEGKTWADPVELETYQTEKRFRQAKLNWDSKQRRENFLKEANLLPKPAGKTESASSGH